MADDEAPRDNDDDNVHEHMSAFEARLEQNRKKRADAAPIVEEEAADGRGQAFDRLYPCCMDSFVGTTLLTLHQ